MKTAFEKEGPWEALRGSKGGDAVVYFFTNREENSNTNTVWEGSGGWSLFLKIFALRFMG